MTRSAPRWRGIAARAVTEATAPAVVCVLLLTLVSYHSARTAREALGWALLTVLSVAAPPTLWVISGVRSGRFTDHHVRDRSQRGKPLLVAFASALSGLALLLLADAPRALAALVVAMALGLAVVTAVTRFWKVSLHTAVASGAMVVLLALFGRSMLALGPALLVVGWSRVELGDHTPGQVWVGAGLGALAAGATFACLRPA